MFDLSKRQDTSERQINSRIHNEIDGSISNKSKKYSLCRIEKHNRSHCPYKQVDP